MLLWPAAALLLVGMAYARFGTTVFQKREGRQSLAARSLLAPYRVAAWLSSRWFTRHDAPSAEVVSGVWIGRAPSRADYLHAQPASILDLTAEFHARPAARLIHRSVPMLDLVAPTQRQLQHAVDTLDLLYTQHAPVLVHCALGYSRSALVIAAWLMRRGLAASSAQAVAMVRRARPRIVINAAFDKVLQEFSHVQTITP
jgi:protein-tyrosine phosphatase